MLVPVGNVDSAAKGSANGARGLTREIDRSSIGPQEVVGVIPSGSNIGGVPRNAFEMLLGGLRNRMRGRTTSDAKEPSKHITPDRGGGEAESGEENNESQDEQLKSHRRRLRALTKFQAVLEEILTVEDVKGGEENRRSLRVQLLEVTLYVHFYYPETAFENAYPYAQGWVAKTVRAESASSKIDELDRVVVSLAMVLGAIGSRTVDDLNGAKQTAHKILEQYVGGDVDPGWARECLFAQGQLDHLCLDQPFSNRELEEFLEKVLKTKTPRMIAIELFQVMQKESLDINNPLLQNSTLRDDLMRLADDVPADRRLFEVKDDRRSCQRCNLGLPLMALGELEARHLARCSNCGAINFKMVP